MSETPETTESTETTAEATKRVFVTGGSGFVGRWVVRELLANGYDVTCLVRDRDKLLRQLTDAQKPRVRCVLGDLFDSDAINRAAEGCDAAIHLVGIIEENAFEGQTFSRVHVEATRNVLIACESAGVGRYVHMSALGTRANAVSKYHQTKWFAEELVRQSKMAWTIFRPSLIHGPDGEFMQMMKFFSTSNVLQPVMPYFGSGENLIQPIHVRDVAACFVKSLSMPETERQVYELGGPDQLSWKELYDVCAEEIRGRRRLKVSVPVPIAKLVARTVMPLAPSFLVPYKFNVGQVQMSQEDSVCDISPIEQTFDLKLRSFRETLSQYAEQIA